MSKPADRRRLHYLERNDNEETILGDDVTDVVAVGMLIVDPWQPDTIALVPWHRITKMTVDPHDPILMRIANLGA